MTIRDLYSGQHSSSDAKAVAAYEVAVHNLAAHRPAVPEALASALDADPGFIAAHALKGFGSVLLGRGEMLSPARSALSLARDALDARGGTSSERALVEALKIAATGNLLSAAVRLDARLDEEPLDFLAMKLAHALRFMGGDGRGMLASTSAILDAWSPSTPGYGFLLGCHAFSLEETGEYASAESIGLEAIRREPWDAWGLHAITHVYEMEDRTTEGIVSLGQHRRIWSQCNNFAFHMAWHLAVFHLAQGRHDLALALYDKEVRPTPTDDFRDVANAVSLLWRLRQEEVDVGDRWSELHSIAMNRRRDTTLIFASLHHLFALLAVGDQAAAQDLLDAISDRAAACAGDQSHVAAEIGQHLGHIVASAHSRQSIRWEFSRLANRLPKLGGSHAQRDVFLRTLALIAAESGDNPSLEGVLAFRRRLKREDRFERIVFDRLAAAEPSSALRRSVA